MKKRRRLIIPRLEMPTHIRPEGKMIVQCQKIEGRPDEVRLVFVRDEKDPDKNEVWYLERKKNEEGNDFVRRVTNFMEWEA